MGDTFKTLPLTDKREVRVISTGRKEFVARVFILRAGSFGYVDMTAPEGRGPTIDDALTSLREGVTDKANLFREWLEIIPATPKV